MRRTLQLVLPLVILCFFATIIYWIFANSVEPQTQRFAPPSPHVVTRVLEKEDFGVTLHSQGAVRARTESSLIPEVRGRIVEIASNFQEGAFFEEGDILLQIDDRDYRAELIVAEAALAEAELALQQENARHEQARRDWERLNPGTTATELTLRKPQLKQAQAAAASAEARVETAKLNLERTKVRAPYAGRVLSKSVDVGQYVSVGSQMATIYAVDYAEVRLPLTASQYSFLDLPSVYRGANPSIEGGPKVVLSSQSLGKTYKWEGQIVRSEGAVDSQTRQIFVVAQVEDPYGASVPGRPPLKVGSFVQAEIEGRTLRDVYEIPRGVYRENSYVLIVSEDGFLNRRLVNSIWENELSIIVDAGLGEGELLCLTDVPYALEGLQVQARDEDGKPMAGMLTESASKPGSSGAASTPSGQPRG
ncbi:efflux RND transporter periplasmic adaptor subunit [Pelagicoccus albus]|uniref:Efflux RND transporter periplasmic adaptor subunit n=1 Tax=Pelagicoccus albus TaxID=415222 RepID=A0A7X1B497_9BACT|nr:efflux RND transporter periplasmic adaptor subunit [Pelagicoccus albus]MBC2605351.1 efflux RND transporter periplasmic adaptor subunit [Pelagicoccus albus]